MSRRGSSRVPRRSFPRDRSANAVTSNRSRARDRHRTRSSLITPRGYGVAMAAKRTTTRVASPTSDPRKSPRRDPAMMKCCTASDFAESVRARGSPMFGFDVAEPRLHAGEEVWLGAMRTVQFGDVSPESGEPLCVEVDASVNLVVCCGTNELKRRRHYKTPIHLTATSDGRAIVARRYDD
jgi:hypothetical protein